jgi:predicted O-methyltransferase YrrM
VSQSNGEERKSCVLAAPSYGPLTFGAACGIFRATANKLIVRIEHSNSSLLAQNFNIPWAAALNKARKGERVDYFAMLHADCEPQDFWLDTLVEELEAKKLDVLGVVAPLKDARGVTSTALARPDGDTWRPHARLTLSEVYRLPETFTGDDVGYPLLLNTGCWVCRFDEAWARQVHFTVNDRIAFDPKKDVYFVQTEPEDWFFSRLLHELGLRVGCTRKVRLGHRGDMVFGNTRGWGENEFDREYLTESVVKAPPPPDWFPHDAAGWLTVAEGAELAELAAGKNVLEIGSYCGRSTVCLAQKALAVYAVDTFDGRGTAMEGNTYPLFVKNLRRYGVEARVHPLVGTSAEILPNLPPTFDAVFVDGSHDYESVKRDAELARAVLRPGGLLAFHDCSDKDPEVRRAVGELIRAGAEVLRQVDSLVVIRPAVAAVTVGD